MSVEEASALSGTHSDQDPGDDHRNHEAEPPPNCALTRLEHHLAAGLNEEPQAESPADRD